MKIIILIIADDTKEYYVQMQNNWRKYMNTHPDIKSYFIKFSLNIIDDVIIDELDKTIWIKGMESYIPGILDKTIKSMKFLVENNFDFDYIFRTNLSSVVHLSKLYNYLMKNTVEYGGPLGKIKLKKEHRKYIKAIDNFDSSNRVFPSGTGILLGKNVVEFLLKEKIDYNIIDDLSIGFTLSKYYKLFPLQRYILINYNSKIIENDDLFLYRCKSSIEHLETINLMNKVIEIIYK